MALTLEAEQRLKAGRMIDFFERDRKPWRTAAQESFNFLKTTFPTGVAPRPDDVAQILHPVIIVSQALQDELNVRKHKQKFWKRHFTDLIIDRLWNEIST